MYMLLKDVVRSSSFVCHNILYVNNFCTLSHFLKKTKQGTNCDETSFKRILWYTKNIILSLEENDYKRHYLLTFLKNIFTVWKRLSEPFILICIIYLKQSWPLISAENLKKKWFIENKCIFQCMLIHRLCIQVDVLIFKCTKQKNDIQYSFNKS